MERHRNSKFREWRVNIGLERVDSVLEWYETKTGLYIGKAWDSQGINHDKTYSPHKGICKICRWWICKHIKEDS